MKSYYFYLIVVPFSLIGGGSIKISLPLLVQKLEILAKQRKSEEDLILPADQQLEPIFHQTQRERFLELAILKEKKLVSQRKPVSIHSDSSLDSTISAQNYLENGLKRTRREHTRLTMPTHNRYRINTSATIPENDHCHTTRCQKVGISITGSAILGAIIWSLQTL